METAGTESVEASLNEVKMRKGPQENTCTGGMKIRKGIKRKQKVLGRRKEREKARGRAENK